MFQPTCHKIHVFTLTLLLGLHYAEDENQNPERVCYLRLCSGHGGAVGGGAGVLLGLRVEGGGQVGGQGRVSQREHLASRLNVKQEYVDTSL